MKKTLMLVTVLAMCLLTVVSGCSGKNSEVLQDGFLGGVSAAPSIEGTLDSTNGGQNSQQIQQSSTQPQQSSTQPQQSSTQPQQSSTQPQQSSTQPQQSSSTPSGELSESDKAFIVKATNTIAWQLDNGGWGKNYDTTQPFTKYPSDYCWKVSGKFVGTIDNNGTHNEMRRLALAYDMKADSKFKASFDKGFAFLKKLQYSSGGFSQIYPHNGKYNDLVTLNDDAMAKVLLMLQDVADNKDPYKNIVSASQRADAKTMINKGIEYLIKAQITVQGVKAGWCAQHDPTSYKPMKGRDYELASVSGKESIGVIQFLLKQTDKPEAVKAANDAIAWLKAHRIANTAYSKSKGENSFYAQNGSSCWYRFYNLNDGKGFFCNRDGKVFDDFAKFCENDKKENGGKFERVTGYDWAGNWLTKAGLDK